MFFRLLSRRISSNLDWQSVLETLGNKANYTKQNAKSLIKNLNSVIQHKKDPNIHSETQEIISTSLLTFSKIVPKLGLDDLLSLSNTVVKFQKTHPIIKNIENSLTRQDLSQLNQVQILILARNLVRANIKNEAIWTKVEEMLFDLLKLYKLDLKALASAYWALKKAGRGGDLRTIEGKKEIRDIDIMFELIVRDILKNNENLNNFIVFDLAEAILTEDLPNKRLLEYIVDGIEMNQNEIKGSGVALVLAAMAKARFEYRIFEVERICLEKFMNCGLKELSLMCQMYGSYLVDVINVKGPRQEFLSKIEDFIDEFGVGYEGADKNDLLFKMMWGLSQKNYFRNQHLWISFMKGFNADGISFKGPVVDDFMIKMKENGFLNHLNL